MHTFSGLTLRSYQEQAARAILDAVLGRRGLSLVVMFPRQSGKNELQAQIEAFLLAELCDQDVEMVKASPTWKPQSLNAMRRLERVLRNPAYLEAYPWKKEQGYIYRCGRARLFFLSGAPVSNIVGATANLLLELDEAQDILEQKYDKEIAPMAASTNATRVFWGTAWTSRTLLARELRLARQLEAADGLRRAFVTEAGAVAAESPAYGKFVDEQVRRFGRQHPLVRTQYYSEEIDSGGGLFSLERQALLRGTHPRRSAPEPGAGSYALLIDVGGVEEGATGAEALRALLDDSARPRHAGRDATALTVVEVQAPGAAGAPTLLDPLAHAPTYHIVHRQAWVGVRHSELYAEICALAEHWQARYVVIDATGVGAGLASFLAHSLPAATGAAGRVIPFIFSARSKSDLGWRFLTMINEGRIKDWAPEAGLEPVAGLGPGTCLVPDTCYALFWQQVDACQGQVQDGPGRLLRWGVPDGTRDPASGELVHDDLLVSAALCGVLDSLPWQPPAAGDSAIAPGVDPLAGLGEAF